MAAPADHAVSLAGSFDTAGIHRPLTSILQAIGTRGTGLRFGMVRIGRWLRHRYEL